MALTALQLKKADDGMLDGGKVHFRSDGGKPQEITSASYHNASWHFPCADELRRHVSEDIGAYVLCMYILYSMWYVYVYNGTCTLSMKCNQSGILTGFSE